MQTRKRAKSVTFGKKAKKEEEVKKPEVKEQVKTADAEKVSEKAEVVAKKAVPEKTLTDELSPTPPADKSTEEKPEASVSTPTNEFVTDTPLSTTPDASKETSGAAIVTTPEEPTLAAKKVETTEPAATPETPLQPTLSPEKPDTPATNTELSQTLPPSAFSVQSGETTEDEVDGDGGKKRYWLYFLVVAFLAFILGLGAMAAVSYSGLMKLPFPKLPTNAHLPAVLTKASPTPAPTTAPTTAPTEKPVDLKAYTISVLNGSGISGKAADVKTSLTTAGFKVSTTGNADKNDYTKTQITAKKSVDQAFLTKLEDELKKTYVLDTVTTSDAGKADVIVTLGKDTTK